MIGLVYVIIAQSLWALELILVRKFFPTQNAILMAAMTSIIGSIFYLPFIFVIKQKFSSVEWIVLIILGLTAWFMAQVLYVRGIQLSQNAYLASVVTLTMPLMAALMSVLVLKEPITFRMLIGGLFMGVGFLIISLR